MPRPSARLTSAFHKFIGHSLHFGHLVYAKKRLVMRLSLANDVSVLGTMFDRISEKNRWYRDYTLDALTLAVRETIACFPVYRTYLAPGRPVSDADRAVIERAVAAAKRRNPALEESVFNFLRDILLFRFPENLDDAARAEHVHFVLKFQQITGPIMAKGLEDTAFYIYNRLAALNEVGGEPQRFGLSGGRVSPPERRAAEAMAGDAPRNFHARHEAERRRARADGGDFGNAGTLAPFVEPLAHLQSALEATDRRKRGARRATRNICFTRRCSAPGRCEPLRRAG